MIDRFLATSYPAPPCWHLVSDVYVRELGIRLPGFDAANDPAAIARAFRLALHEGKHGFVRAAAPQNYDVVLLGRSRPTHCGLWYDDGVVHALSTITIWEPLAQIADRYPFMEFWTRGHD